MAIRNLVARVCALACGTLIAMILLTVYADAETPKAFTVIETMSLLLENQTVKIYRNGDRAMVEQSAPPQSSGGDAEHTRAYFDFAAGNSWTQIIGDPTAVPCIKRGFNRNDWGDPFTESANLLDRLAKEKTTDHGMETVQDIKAKLVSATAPDGSATAKVWIEPKTNLIVKFELAPKDGPTRIMIEVKELKLAPPPAAVFEVPAICRKAS